MPPFASPAARPRPTPPTAAGAAALLLSTLGTGTFAAEARAQAEARGAADGAVGLPAATVPVTDAATGVVDQLLALVPVRGGIVGQRPYAVREVARLASAVVRELDRRDSVRRAATPARAATGALAPERPAAEARAAGLARALLDAYGAADRPASAVTVRALDFAWLHGVGSGERPRAVPPTNGPGSVDARTLPALDLRFGRPAVQGAVGSLETGHAVGVGRWLALVAQPRASLVVERRPDGGAATRVNVEPQRLFARAVAGNVALQAGLDEWAWGQGGAAGVFLSANARPLRALSVGSDTAFALPGWLRGAGRLRAVFAVADLGRDQNFAHAKLAAYKVNLAPGRHVELGAGVMSEFGGRGAPPLTLAQRAVDLFPFVGWLNEGSDRLSSNKLANLEARVRAPGWRGLSAAYELTLDDFDVRRVGGVLRDDANHLLDVSVARLRADGSLALAVRAQRTGLRMYEHAQFTSGVTYRGAILGAPLGPNARALGATLTWRPAPFDAVSAAAAYEARDASVYQTVTAGPNDVGFGFRLVEARPVERRLRLGVAAERALPGRGASLALRLGGERVGSRAFAAGTTVTRPFGEAGARVRF